MVECKELKNEEKFLKSTKLSPPIWRRASNLVTYHYHWVDKLKKYAYRDYRLSVSAPVCVHSLAPRRENVKQIIQHWQAWRQGGGGQRGQVPPPEMGKNFKKLPWKCIKMTEILKNFRLRRLSDFQFMSQKYKKFSPAAPKFSMCKFSYLCPPENIKRLNLSYLCPPPRKKFLAPPLLGDMVNLYLFFSKISLRRLKSVFDKATLKKPRP